MLEKILYQNQAKLKEEITDVLLEAFPEEERPPVNYFFESLKNAANTLVAYFDRDTFIGFAFLSKYQDVCYIFFLAVKKEYRRQGYGGQILENIKQDYQDYVLMIAYEEVNPQYPNYLERVNREKFYLSHGFKNNNLKTNEYGVIYQTAYIGNRQVTFKEYKEIFILGFGKRNENYVKEVK